MSSNSPITRSEFVLLLIEMLEALPSSLSLPGLIRILRAIEEGEIK